MPFERIILLKGDIADMDCDAVVNAANTELVLGSGVAGAIREKGGQSIEDEAIKQGPIEPGEAVLTRGGTLNAAYVIHAATMHPGKDAESINVAKATRSALRIARDKQFKSVALPALGTGVGGLSINRCARVMLESIIDFLNEYEFPKYVYIVLYGNDAFVAFKDTFKSLKP